MTVYILMTASSFTSYSDAEVYLTKDGAMRNLRIKMDSYDADEIVDRYSNGFVLDDINGARTEIYVYEYTIC